MKIQKVAFIGAGKIGTGLALNCVMCGIPAALLTLQTPEELAQCRERVKEILDFFVENGVLNEDQACQAGNRITYAASVAEAVAGAQIIQESVPENIEVKRKTLQEIENAAAPDAIIATTTSGLSVSEVFANCKHQERCVGGHPYLPAHIIPLIEVTKAQRTSDETIKQVMEFYRMIGKEPVLLQKEMVGFIANRFSSAIHREAVNLVMNQVCSVEDVDKALVYSLGIRWATMGQALSLHLNASPEGIRDFTKKFNWVPGQPNRRLATLADWTVFPENWDQVFADGLEQEIAARPLETGRDIRGIEAWRNKMLLQILRLHKKI